MLVCKLRKILADRKISREDLRKAVGTSDNMITRAINHGSIPLALALDISSFLEMDVSEVWVHVDLD